MKIKIEGFVTEVKLAVNKNGEQVTDVYLAQQESIIKCRWKGDVTEKVQAAVRAEVIGNLVSWVSDRGKIYNMVLCS